MSDARSMSDDPLDELRAMAARAKPARGTWEDARAVISTALSRALSVMVGEGGRTGDVIEDNSLVFLYARTDDGATPALIFRHSSNGEYVEVSYGEAPEISPGSGNFAPQSTQTPSPWTYDQVTQDEVLKAVTTWAGAVRLFD